MARRKLQTADGKPDIRAAGVLLRRDDDRRTRVAVIHRPKYMDWSLPKGKLERRRAGRRPRCARWRRRRATAAELGRELPAVSYLDRKARRKLVRYWLMDPIDGEFKPHGEVDELRWLTPREAGDLLTYDHDRELVRKAIRKRRWRRARSWIS